MAQAQTLGLFDVDPQRILEESHRFGLVCSRVQPASEPGDGSSWRGCDTCSATPPSGWGGDAGALAIRHTGSTAGTASSLVIHRSSRDWSELCALSHLMFFSLIAREDDMPAGISTETEVVIALRSPQDVSTAAPSVAASASLVKEHRALPIRTPRPVTAGLLFWLESAGETADEDG